MENVKKELLDVGFEKDTVYYDSNMLNYTRKDGVKFDIYFDTNKPNKVDCLRGTIPGRVMADGIIGDFVGGKGRMRRFSFNSPKQLIEKLEKINVK